jgi:isoquinoline 1-oxidoreductase alpha subunit
MAKFFLNGEGIDFTAGNDVPLLWAIRDWFGLTGTKFGCGMAQCGACTVHVDGQPKRSCSTTFKSCQGKRITTIDTTFGDADYHLGVLAESGGLVAA